MPLKQAQLFNNLANSYEELTFNTFHQNIKFKMVGWFSGFSFNKVKNIIG